MEYRLRIEKRALKAIQSIQPTIRKRIKRKISALTIQPRLRGAKKLSGTEAIYRIRQGNFRILYKINDDEHWVKIVKVGDRKDVYR